MRFRTPSSSRSPNWAGLRGLNERHPYVPYRAWCLEELQRKARHVPGDARERLRELLSAHACWGPLFELDDPGSRYDDSGVPFRGRKVHYDNER